MGRDRHIVVWLGGYVEGWRRKVGGWEAIVLLGRLV